MATEPVPETIVRFCRRWEMLKNVYEAMMGHFLLKE